MAHGKTIERPKRKPRGRPFPKGNIKGKIMDEVLDSARHSSGDDGTNVITIEESNRSETAIACASLALPRDKGELEVLDSMEFRNGDNKLSIRFSKRSNRMYRIQIFLNDETEIRPVTYNGSSTGVSFWNLLKGALRK